MEIKQKLKHHYVSPKIEIIQLDNEISLALESTPPAYEMIKFRGIANNHSNEPFKTDIG